MTHDDSSQPRPARPRSGSIGANLALLAAGLLVAALAAEGFLAAIAQPRFYEIPPAGSRFDVANQLVDGETFYVNLRSARIHAAWDGDPRGYFDPGASLEYRTNELGFRGPEFRAARPPETLRVMFLGDSFTFGEGVRFADTYPQVAAAALRDAGGGDRAVEALNFGVGGYNTRQSLHLLRMYLDRFAPDVVVLGYVLNDAEPALLAFDPETKSITRRKRELTVPEGLADPRPPDSVFFRSRLARLAWQAVSNRRRSEATIAHYRAINAPESPGWKESRDSLYEIGALCRSRGIPFVVVLFPILVELSDDHPLADVLARVAEAVADSGGILVDLFPRLEALEGVQARDLWVHPTDQHPNERVHQIAGRAVAEAVAPLLRPTAARR